MKLAAAFLILAAACGCVEVKYDGHKPRHVWYWSREAVTERAVKSNLKGWQQTNAAAVEQLNKWQEGNNATGK
jgi:hypothetical protein